MHLGSDGKVVRDQFELFRCLWGFQDQIKDNYNIQSANSPRAAS